MYINKEYAPSIFPLSNKNPVFTEMIKAIKRLKPDVIMVAGTSGLIVAPAIEVKTGIPFGYVRKENDGSHSCSVVEGAIPTDSDKWLVVDDFIGTGRTITRVINHVKEGRCIGVYFYSYGSFYAPKAVHPMLISSIANSTEGQKWLAY